MKRRIVEIDEELCDGCGDCIPSCHEGAIAIADGKARLVSDRLCDGIGDCLGECPQDAIRIVERDAELYDETLVRERRVASEPAAARLGNWPLQLRLLHPRAEFLAGSDLLLCADCVPFAYPDFHRRFLDGRAVVVSCPKLDPREENVERLTAIFAEAEPRRVVVARMTVPCCGGLVQMAEIAKQRAGSDVPIEVEIFGPDGQRLVD